MPMLLLTALLALTATQDPGPRGMRSTTEVQYVEDSIHLEVRIRSSEKRVDWNWRWSPDEDGSRLRRPIPFPTAYWPSAAARIDNATWLIGGMETDGRAIIERWTFSRWHGALPLPEVTGGGRHGTKPGEPLLLVPQRERVDALLQGPGPTPPGGIHFLQHSSHPDWILIGFVSDRSLWRLDHRHPDRPLVPLASPEGGVDILAEPELDRHFDLVECFRHSRHGVVLLLHQHNLGYRIHAGRVEKLEPLSVALFDADGDGNFERSKTIDREGWLTSDLTERKWIVERW